MIFALRRVVPLALPLLLLACKPAAALPAAATTRPEPTADAVAARPRTVIVVRHAEKAVDDPRDPSLSPAGAARARALAELLARAGVTHLFASEFKRTQATLRPLATATGREIVVLPAADRPALVAAIQALPAGSVAVVAGHSNTVPALLIALGGEARETLASPTGPQLPDDAYDRLYLLVLPARGAAQTLELRQAPAAAAASARDQ
jgi:phosphohistidine phosphatase SixA